MQTIHDLQAELTAAGLGRPQAAKMLAKLAFLTLVSAAFYVGVYLVEPFWAKAILLIVGSWINIAAIMCGHDGVHMAVSARRWVNDAVGFFAFTVMGGLATDYWRVKHNLKHHPFCNVAGRDPDVDQWPFAFSEKQHRRSTVVWRAFHHVQAWAFYPIILVFMSPLMRFAGVTHSVRNALSRPKAALDLVMLAAHVALWIGLPLLLGASVSMTLVVYALNSALGGLYLTAIFAPAHMTTPLVESYRCDPMRLQLETTRNFTSNAFFRFTLIGLDQQIEHHLVPRLSSFDLPKARPIVKAFCERNGLPYIETTWLRGLIDTHGRTAIGWNLPEIVIGDPIEVAAAPASTPTPAPAPVEAAVS